MNPYRKKISFLIIILILCILLSIFLGRFFISPKMFFDVLSDSIKGVENNPIESSIIFELRIPRIIMNILVGAGLAISGVAFQGIFQNPLVSPDVISVSSGSAFGAVLGILLFGMNSYVIILALLFGILSVVITYSLSKVRGESSVLSLILSGMVITALFSSLISLVKYTADPYDKLPAITYWLMGSFSSSSYNNIKIAIFPIISGIMILYFLRWRINILSLGDEEVKALGMNPVYIRAIIIIAVTIISATCVTLTGIIGWVGLLIPHICRMYIGADNIKLIPTSCIMGAIFMLIIDGIARTATSSEIPIGILTSLIGAPFFIIIFKKYRSW
ncbi:iron ABC transporter permease [Fusobacterium pseudoperiodonticum]|nr:iron ABC transporter permease [Fusobacterium pseudoperiodonticum]